MAKKQENMAKTAKARPEPGKGLSIQLPSKMPSANGTRSRKQGEACRFMEERVLNSILLAYNKIE